MRASGQAARVIVVCSLVAGFAITRETLLGFHGREEGRISRLELRQVYKGREEEGKIS